MADVSIPWGRETWSVALPGHWKVQQVAAAHVSPAREDWPDRLGVALARPEGTPPLAKLLEARRGGRVVVVVEDVSRHSPLPEVLRLVFRELDHAGVKTEQLEVFFAGGMHPPLTARQAAEKIGPELASRVRWRCNPWRDEDAYVSVGTVRDGARKLDVAIDAGVASAELRILVTAVSPHLQAGFGGGYKLLVPGCAHLDTIRQLHRAALPRRAAQQVGQAFSDNRMRRLIDAAGGAVDRAGGRSFGVQYVLDMEDQLTSIATGDVTACQRMLAKRCAAGYGVLIDAPADVVIAGAHPRDFDLWQSFKAVAHAVWAAREGGAVICLTRCTGGVNMPTLSLPVPPQWVRRAVRLLGADALASLMLRLVPHLALDAAFFVRLALQVLRRNLVGMVSPALAAAETKMVGLPVWADPAGAIAAVEAELPRGPKRVIVFPAGGVTYPIMARPLAR